MVERLDTDRELQQLLEARDLIRDLRLKVREMKEKVLQAESGARTEQRANSPPDRIGGRLAGNRNK